MRLIAVLLVSSPMLAQAISFGLRAGVPMTPAITSNGPAEISTQRWTIGPLVEIHLWRGAAFGADFLFTQTTLALPAAGTTRAGIWRWEAPVSLVYHFPAAIRPFLRTGISFNRIFDISGASECARGPFGERFYCLDGSTLAELRHRGTYGFLAGGGLRVKVWHVRFDPELRITHWIDRNFGVRDSSLRSNLNQATLLVGVIF